MKLNIQTAVLIYVILCAIQWLVPAFVTMNQTQQHAVEMFSQAVGVALGIRSFFLNPDGSSAACPWEPKK